MKSLILDKKRLRKIYFCLLIFSSSFLGCTTIKMVNKSSVRHCPDLSKEIRVYKYSDSPNLLRDPEIFCSEDEMIEKFKRSKSEPPQCDF